VSARRLPGDVQLRRTDDAGGWHVLRTRSDDETQVVIGLEVARIDVLIIVVGRVGCPSGE
jgi:hypothetical protein